MKTSNRNQWEEIKNLRRLWPYIKNQKLALVATLVLVPMISVIQLIQPILLKHAVDEGVMGKNAKELTFYASLFFSLVVCEYLARCGQSLSSTVAVERMIQSMRVKLASHLLRMSLTFHHRTLSGVLVTRSTSEFDNLSESLNEGVLQSVIGIVSIIGCVVGMVSLHPLLGFLSSLMLPLMLWAVAWFSQKKSNSLYLMRGSFSLT